MTKIQRHIFKAFNELMHQFSTATVFTSIFNSDKMRHLFYNQLNLRSELANGFTDLSLSSISFIYI